MTPSGHTRFGRIFPAIPVLAGVAGISSLAAGEAGAERHWALTRVVKPEVPESVNPVDHFVRRSLEEAGLEQNPPADPHTLQRRATLDLTGLPPTREEIAAFAGSADTGAEAWAALVDRLLASPHYGERWGRHWLDVARYVQGTVKVPGIDRIDLAEPYRDYVVRAFNRDKPYDRFIAEQLAGDLLAEKGETSEAYFDRITAPAFLSIGAWFEECTDPNKLRLDIIDEQVSTMTRAFLAMDFACMRCHDGKFDPVPIEDYYALAGIFRSTRITSHFADEWKDGRPRAVRALAETGEIARAADHEQAIRSLLEKRRNLLRELRRSRVLVDHSFQRDALPGEVASFQAENFAGHKNLKTTRIGNETVIASRRRLDQWVKYRLEIPAPGDYTLLVRYAAAEPAPVELERNGETVPGRVLAEPTYGETTEDFRWEPVPLPSSEKGPLHIRLKVDRHEPFPVLDEFRLVPGLLSPADPAWRLLLGTPTHAETARFLPREERAPIREIERRVEELWKTRPSPDLTLAVRDEKEPTDLPVHPGGDVYRTEGDPVSRGNPSFADHLVRDEIPVPESGSGRAQLARWLTHPDHPLTARVMVNRIWHGHFGTGLVRTVDDFGTQGADPTHPELLDWLAAEFIESGWSVKHIHRLILASETYRASSEKTPENLSRDPDGSLLSRYPARRLEIEALYDGMVASIGKIRRQPPGQPLDTAKSKGRALYILTSARSPLGLGIEIRKMFPLFGFDDSGRPMHDRDESVTPQQSLFWLNNPLPRHYAEKLAEKLVDEHEDAGGRLTALYETLLGRPPSREARDAILGYLEEIRSAPENDEREAWARVALGLFSTRAYSHIE